MAIWKTEKLGKLVSFSSGGTPSKKNDSYWNGDIPWISAKTMKSDRISTSDLFITEEGLAKGSKLANAGSLLLLVRGSGLFNGIPVCYVESPVAYNQDVKCISSCSEVENEYIYYWLKANSDYLQAKLDVTGIGAGKFDTKFLAELDVAYPEKETRKKIIDFANNLTDKLQVNESINRNLSEQLIRIFEDMFITNSDDCWPIKKLGDFLDLERGLSYKGKFLSEREGVPMLNLGNILPNSVFRPEKLKFYTGEFKPRHVVNPGDIIIANTDLTQARAVLGSAIRVPELGYETAICSHHISIVKESRISNYFILGLLNMPSYRARVAGYATGTTVLALPNDTILHSEFNCPPKELLMAYDEISEPMYKLI